MVVCIAILSSCQSDDIDPYEEEEQHEAVTLRLKNMLDGDAWLKSMVEKELALGKEINPDPDYNPAQDLESL